MTDLDVRNDDSRPSLTSGAAAEERQDVSSINTMSCLTLSLEAKISASGHPIYRKKCVNIGCKTKNYF